MPINKTEIVRKHFEESRKTATVRNTRIDDLLHGKCKYCQKEYKMTQGWKAIGPLYEHLEKVHPEKLLPKETFNDIQKGLAYTCAVRGIPNSLFACNNVRESLIYPMNDRSIVECKSELAAEAMSKMQQVLRASPTRNCTMAFDIGTVDGIRSVYCLIVNTCVETAFLIDSFEMTNGASANAIQAYLVKAIEKFLFFKCGNIIALCSDNAANVLLAAKQVSEMEQFKHMLVFNCGCHVLNLVSGTVDESLKLDSGAIANLQQSGTIRKWCATRWWSRYDCLHEALKKKAAEMLAEKPALVASISDYVSATADLRVGCRSLERDCATMPLAVHVLLDLINTGTQLVSDASLQRYLKFYAPNSGVTLMAFVSPHLAVALKSLDQSSGDSGRSTIVREFVALVTRICSLNKSFHVNEVSKAVNNWCNPISETQASILQLGDTLGAFSVAHMNLVDVIAYVAKYIQAVAASEALAERFYSRFEFIRASRFHLSHERGVEELIIAFNPSPYADNEIATGRKRTREEPTDCEEVTEVFVEQMPTDPAEELHRYFVKPTDVPFLSAPQCKFVLMSHVYMTKYYDKLEEKRTVSFWNVSCWVSGTCVHVDKTALIVRIIVDPTLEIKTFTLSEAFKLSLQLSSRNHIKFY